VHILLAALSTGYHSKLRDAKFLAADLQTEEIQFLMFCRPCISV